MARKDAAKEFGHNPPQRKLEYLLNETYSKIDELKELMRKEASITGFRMKDLEVQRMFDRQDYLVTLCAEACIELERRNAAALAGSSSRTTVPLGPSTSTKIEKEDTKGDGSWYGSLDRNLSKKKRHQFFDKRRRHTKTIGSLAGLDVIKKSSELKPDEQYELGIPTPPRVTPSRSSIFPMTQHQYYSALMTSKLAKTPAYPLEVRQLYPTPAPSLHHHHNSHNHHHMYRHGHNVIDENKNWSRKKEMMQQQQHQVPSTSFLHPSMKTVPPPLSSRGLPSEMELKQSLGSAPKLWYETSLDDHGGTVVPPHISQSASPSPSMISRDSSRGSVASAGLDTIDSGLNRMTVSSPANESTEFNSKSSESSETWSGNGNEITKPFEMSDYYKYSTKFRNRTSPGVDDGVSSSQEPKSPSIGISQNHIPLKSSMHSRHPAQVRLQKFESNNVLRDANANVGPKLPPKQKRNQPVQKLEEELLETATGEPSKEVWITNQPTFV